MVRFVKSTSSKSTEKVEVDDGEDQNYYVSVVDSMWRLPLLPFPQYGMLRLASAWDVSKDAITNLAKRISACSTIINSSRHGCLS